MSTTLGLDSGPLLAAGPGVVDRVLGADVDYIAYAVPFFFAMIVLELAFVVAARRDYVRLNDSLTDLACGTLEQVLGVFLKTLLFAGYIYVFNNFRLLEIAEFSPAGKWAAAIALFFGVDFCFYWFHRFAHEMALPWATHVVHHSSEELNLIVALRQSALEDCLAWVFYLPLALIGFPPLWYAAMFSFNLIWQFWCHTRLIGKLGPIEWVFNTPSHHRVHHARNPRYLDKNYAGTLIIWDRLFGTFVEEDEECVYGITKPVASWNPFWANFHYWWELAQTSWRAPYLADKFKVWFKPLGWTPRGLEPVRFARELKPSDVIKYNPRVPWGLSLYALFQFLLTAALAQYVLVAADRRLPLWSLLGPAAVVLWGLLNFGGLLEQRRWAARSELARLAAAVAGSLYLLAPSTTVSVAAATGVVILGLVSYAWLVVFLPRLTAPAWAEVAKAGYVAAQNAAGPPPDADPAAESVAAAT